MILKSCGLLYRTRFAEVHGTHYARGNVVLCTFDEDIPIFGLIVDIIIPSSQDCLFILVPYIGYSFNHHFNSYEVQINSAKHLVYRQSELLDYHPLNLSNSFSSALNHTLFVCLKYHVFL